MWTPGQLFKQTSASSKRSSPAYNWNSKVFSHNSGAPLLHWLPIKQRVQFKMLILIFKAINGLAPNYKQLLDEVFVISGIIRVEVSVISRSRRLRLITLTETLIIPDITKTESNNWFIILYLQVISQFLAGLMKRIEKPFLLRCPWTWHCCLCTWHCFWKSCIARATYRLFTNL